MPPEVIPITQENQETAVRKAVKEHYAKLALQTECCSNDCCTESIPGDTQTSLPEEAVQVAAGCGSPLSHTDIAPGQVIVDLGSGGGIDVFRASKLVGLTGRAIGIDATPEMIWRARETARKNEYTNVEFRLGEIEHMPLENESADWVVSNCVINLAPNKEAVFKEAFRILKRGGRVVVSDIVAEEPIPPEAQRSMEEWAACLTGAILEDEYLSDLQRAGFMKIQVVERKPVEQRTAEESLQQKLKLASLTITAQKPADDRN